MAMKVIGIIFAVFLLIGVFREDIANGIDDIRTDDITENALVTTAAGITSANVTLNRDLYQADLTEISSITSDNVTDTPVATAYDEDTKVLTVAGLAAADTRVLAFAYRAEVTTLGMRTLGPWLAFIVFGILLYFAVKPAFSKGKR